MCIIRIAWWNTTSQTTKRSFKSQNFLPTHILKKKNFFLDFLFKICVCLHCTWKLPSKGRILLQQYRAKQSDSSLSKNICSLFSSKTLYLLAYSQHCNTLKRSKFFEIQNMILLTTYNNLAKKISVKLNKYSYCLLLTYILGNPAFVV